MVFNAVILELGASSFETQDRYGQVHGQQSKARTVHIGDTVRLTEPQTFHGALYGSAGAWRGVSPFSRDSGWALQYDSTIMFNAVLISCIRTVY